MNREPQSVSLFRYEFGQTPYEQSLGGNFATITQTDILLDIPLAERLLVSDIGEKFVTVLTKMSKLDVFIYNYLVNLGGRFYRENPDNDVLAWGYDDVHSQIGILNGRNKIAELQQAAKEINIRQAALVSIVFNTRRSSEPIFQVEYQLMRSKAVLIPRGDFKGSTQRPASFKIKKVDLTDVLKNGARSAGWSKIAKDLSTSYKPQNILFLIRADMLTILRFSYPGGHTGFILAIKLKQLTFFEVVANNAVLAHGDVRQIIGSAINVTSSHSDQVVVIMDKNMSATVAKDDFIIKENIYYLERRAQAKTPDLPAMPFSAVLKRKAEYLASMETICSLGLPKHLDGPKNWDSLAALVCVGASGRLKKNSKILDAGGEYYSVFLHHMALQGYSKLYCVNLAFKENKIINGIRYIPGDITATTFGANSLSVVTCLSVLEHGVDQESFFKEMNRVMIRHGILFISVDFWCTPVDTMGQTSYGAPIKIFTKSDVLDLIDIAKTYNFQLIEPIHLTCSEKVISSDDLNYTFLYLTFRKS